MKTTLVTGSSGFIGYFVANALLAQGWQVIGVDSMSDYYDVKLKQSRLDLLEAQSGFINVKGEVQEQGLLTALFAKHKPEIVIHLAAQAGVRYSLENPMSYFQTNLGGTLQLLEAARAHPPKHMLMVSSSSAYGANTLMPYNENIQADHQISLYAATKKSSENIAHSYAHLFALPDHLTQQGMFAGDSLSPVAPYRVVNIGNSDTVPLLGFIKAIEDATGVVAEKNLLPMQPGDVPATWADASLLKALTGYLPKTSVRDGVASFVA
ncbi:GDP-mannose 4,6-dehydratase [bacterium]|nr:GDP-mannose 4,6-dehydratase [bacterium]